MVKHSVVLVIELHNIFIENFFYTFLTEIIFGNQVADVLICNLFDIGLEIAYDFLSLFKDILEHEYLVWDETHFSERKCLRLGLWEANEYPVLGGTVLLELRNFSLEDFNNDIIVDYKGNLNMR